MSRRWANGSSRAWRRTRALVLQRDGYRCQLKLDGCTGRGEHVHHTMPREIVGDDVAHLVAACPSCNYKIGDPTRHDPPPTVRPWW